MPALMARICGICPVTHLVASARACDAILAVKIPETAAVLSSFHYHCARLIEILFGLERIEQLLHPPAILSKQVRAHARPNNFEGIGVSEAPRGTLIHHYLIDENGLIERANLIIATGFNNLAMNRGILQAARPYISSLEIQEGMLNRVEAVIRSFDPSLSCSTHAVGAMPLVVELGDADGRLLDRKER
jgi:NAD-reducing hydrogenase large subunit